MRTTGPACVLEFRRRLAVERIAEGYSTEEVAEFLGVAARTVRRWVDAFHREGCTGLAARPVPGRPTKLTACQERIVCRWLDDKPTQHGFATDLWTALRLAQLIEQEWKIHFHPDYLTVWLRQHGFTPQRPRRQAREHDEKAIAAWLARDWPRIKKRRVGGTRACFGWTRAGS
jgi:transposase